MNSSNFHFQPKHQLSPEGRRRQAEIRQQLVDHQRLRLRQRRLRGAGSLLAFVLTIGLASWIGLDWLTPPAATGPDLAQPSSPSVAPRVAVVGNRPAVVDRYVVQRDRPQGAVTVETLDDQQLVELMSQVDPQTIIARIGGELRVVRTTEL